MRSARGSIHAVILLVVTLATWVVLPYARADANPSVSISDVKATSGQLTGVLTFRSSGAVDVDQASVKATVDGKNVPITVQKSTHIARTAILVIDTSGSMGTSGMATVRSATATFLREAPADVKVGVVTFSNTAGVDLKPTLDRAAVQRVVDGLVANGNTSLYAAMADAATTLAATGGDRSIVLLSDGADTMSKDPTNALAKDVLALKAAGIRVDVVRFNTDDPAARKALQQFAGASGGSVIAAKDSATVGAAFRKAARALQSQAQFVITLPSLPAGSHELTVTGSADGKPFATTKTGLSLVEPSGGAPTTAPQPAPVVKPPATAPPVQHAPWLPWAAALAIGSAVFLFAFAMLNPTFQTRRQQRLAAIETYAVPGTHAARPTQEAARERSSSLVEQLTAIAERMTKGRKWSEKTMQMIDRADLPFRAGEWAILRVVAVVVGAAVCMVLFGNAKVFGFIVGAVVGFAVPTVFLRWKAHRRAAAFERLLPQALLLASSSLRSGFSLNQALESVAKDSPEPVAKEISRALAETRIGTDIADALDRVSERMGTESMKMTVMAIRIQREVGGNLAETLETGSSRTRV